MDFDFELVLVIGSVISGIGWALEAFWAKPKRLARLNEQVVAAGGQLPDSANLEEVKEPVWDLIILCRVDNYGQLSKSLEEVLASGRSGAARLAMLAATSITARGADRASREAERR